MMGPSNSKDPFQFLYRKAWKAMRDYRMIQSGDRVLLGISGGKDSLLLTEVMALQSRKFPGEGMVTAAHIAMEGDPYRADGTYLGSFCREQGIPLIIRTIPCPFTQTKSSKKPPCFLCSWERRKALFALAAELKCNKIALGHNLDDVLQTFLMNQIFQGSLSTIPPVLHMSKFPVTLIRPLYLIEEKHIVEYASFRGYQPVEHTCPHEKATHRQSMKTLLFHFESLNPRAKSTMIKAMHNVMQEYLPKSAAN